MSCSSISARTCSGCNRPTSIERLLRLIAHAFARADVDLQDLALDRSTDDGPFDFGLDLGDLGLGLIDGRAGDGEIGLPRSGQQAAHVRAGPVAIAGRRLRSSRRLPTASCSETACWLTSERARSYSSFVRSALALAACTFDSLGGISSGRG